MKFSVNLYEEELVLLNNYMKQNNLKSKSDAIRKCVKTATKLESIEDKLEDINNKLNRIIYRENIQKKLLEQFYANMEFPIDQDVKTNESLKRFYENNNFYSNKIMDQFMNERIKNFKRRSISLPNELDEIISIKFKNTNYSFMNDFLIELLELGLIKLNEDIEIKNRQIEIINKIDKLIQIKK